MKKLNSFKVGVILSLLLVFSQNLFAQKFILNDDNLIDPRAKEKINKIAVETKQKTGISVYVYVKTSLKLDKDIEMRKKFEHIKNFEKNIVSNLSNPYIILTMFVEDTHVNLINSQNLNGIVDKNDVLDGYVIPLLASKDKNSLYAKVSAGVLNGYSAIVDSISEAKKVTIESNADIGNQGKVSSTIWRVFMYTLVVTGLVIYTLLVLKNRKK